MVICLGTGGDLHMTELIPLPLTVQIGSGTGSPGNPRHSPEGHKQHTDTVTQVCVCVCVCVCVHACVI